MLNFVGHRIINGNDGFTVILYLDHHHTEFATELGEHELENKDDIQKSAREYIKEKFPNFKINIVKVMLGSMLLASFPLNNMGQAAELPAVPEPDPQTQTMSIASTPYTVQPGDTLFFLARTFNTTIDAIKQANNLTGDMIYIGQTLTIPSAAQHTTYKVVAGDSLFNIARQFNTTIDAIKQANNLTGDTIYIGQTLIIPAKPAQTPPASEQQPALTIGATGAAVENLQRNLQNLGFLSAVSGTFDQATAEAVRKFQNLNGLPVTGIADQTTLAKIDRALIKKQIATEAAKYSGTPYVWGGASPAGFDCSGFVYYMFNSYGINIPRTTSRDLYNMGTPISRAQLQPGDLVFFAINEPGVISHVGIYVGDNQFISATSSKGVWTTSLDNTFWSQYYVGAIRV